MHCLKSVGQQNVPIFRTRHDDSMLSLIMLAFVNVSFSEFNGQIMQLL